MYIGPGEFSSSVIPRERSRRGSKPSLPGRVLRVSERPHRSSRARESRLWTDGAGAFHSKTPCGEGFFQEVPEQSESVDPAFPASVVFRGRRLLFATCSGRAPCDAGAGALTKTRAILNLSHSPEKHHEEDLSTQGSPETASSRLQTSHAHPRRARHHQGASWQGPQATGSLIPNHSGSPETFVESYATGTGAGRGPSWWLDREVGLERPESGSSSPAVSVKLCDAIA